MISIKILELIAKAENVVMYLFIKKTKRISGSINYTVSNIEAFNSIKMTLQKNKVHTIKRKCMIKFISKRILKQVSEWVFFKALVFYLVEM